MNNGGFMDDRELLWPAPNEPTIVATARLRYLKAYDDLSAVRLAFQAAQEAEDRAWQRYEKSQHSWAIKTHSFSPVKVKKVSQDLRYGSEAASDDDDESRTFSARDRRTNERMVGKNRRPTNGQSQNKEIVKLHLLMEELYKEFRDRRQEACDLNQAHKRATEEFADARSSLLLFRANVLNRFQKSNESDYHFKQRTAYTSQRRVWLIRLAGIPKEYHDTVTVRERDLGLVDYFFGSSNTVGVKDHAHYIFNAKSMQMVYQREPGLVSKSG